MLLPRGAVEDLLKELRTQQAAAEAQQAQQVQASQLGSYHGLHLHSSISQAAHHAFNHADDMQQLTDLPAGLNSGLASMPL